MNNALPHTQIFSSAVAEVKRHPEFAGFIAEPDMVGENSLVQYQGQKDIKDFDQWLFDKLRDADANTSRQ